ncbi:MAG: hypothetical protein ACM3Q2_15795 [Syntrophothermus sp.]
MNKWLNIKREHVLEAIELFDASRSDYPAARSTFLFYKNKRYPAKHIRGMAYEMANKEAISKEAYTGGMETVRFFEKLGFMVEYTGKNKTPRKITKPVRRKRAHKSHMLDVVEQKNALQILLQKHVGFIETERKFPWMKTPEITSPGEEYRHILSELGNGNSSLPNIKSNYSLLCDMVISKHKIIIEYDERQHFSLARKKSLLNYPKGVQLFYDKGKWLTACESIRAVDNCPPGRDEVRAFYDSVRDIEAFKNGYILIRIKHGDFDWISEDAGNYLMRLLKPYLNRLAGKDNSKLLADKSVENLKEWKTLKIGRAVLNLLSSKQEIESSGNPWKGHKKVMERFIGNKEDYFRRLGNIKDIARENKVNILLLPACTAIYGNGTRLEEYCRLFTDIPWTIMGSFNSVDWDDENLMILNYGKKLEMFDSQIVKHIQMDCVQVLTAISSTITGIKKSWGETETWGEIVKSEINPPEYSLKIIALDSGHHQYNGRYTLSLNSVLRHLKKHYKYPTVILSYWRFRNGAINCPWAYSGSKIRIERIESDIVNEEQTDILDIISV